MAELKPRKFRRKQLQDKLPDEIWNDLVVQTEDFLARRFEHLAKEFDDISKTNFNPFLLLITSPVYNTFSPFEVAERLQLGKAFHGDDTAFGRMAEERYLRSFGAHTPAEKAKKRAAWEPVDTELTIEGQRYLLSIKSGPWTMNQGHANAMIEKFPAVYAETGANIILGVTYGRYENLNNKPKLVETGLKNPAWFDYLVGKDFWEFVSGVKDVHTEIFKAIRTAQKNFAEKHKEETFHERLVANRLKIASSLRKQFNIEEDEDFWSTLFHNAF